MGKKRSREKQRRRKTAAPCSRTAKKANQRQARTRMALSTMQTVGAHKGKRTRTAQRSKRVKKAHKRRAQARTAMTKLKIKKRRTAFARQVWREGNEVGSEDGREQRKILGELSYYF